MVGERVRIDGIEREIVGVLPEDLRFPEPETRVWLPLELDPAATQFGAVGVCAVVSYLVTLRTREIGVRMALGSTRRRVVALVAARSIAVGAAGALGGVAASFLLGRFMGAVLYRVQPHDPWTLAAAVAAVVAAVTLASVLPARRAAGIDPAEVMRAE